MEAGLVDRIYECAFVPEAWPDVLGELAVLADARAGFLFVSKGNDHRVTSSSQTGTEALQPLVRSGWLWRSERFQRFSRVRLPGFFPDSDFYTEAEKAADPFYQELLFPRGLGVAAGAMTELPTGDTFGISLERERSRGPITPRQIAALNAVWSHSARSALLATRLTLDRARSVGDMLAALGLAALVVSDGGNVLAVNDPVAVLKDFVCWRAQGKVSLADRRADALLQDALTKTDREVARDVLSFPIRDAEDAPALIAHLVPVRLSARDIFSRGTMVIVLTPIRRPDALPVELVQSLFDLTAAEARVARALAGGKAPDTIAREGSVSISTVRTQVRGVLEKTGCHRLTEVVALLGGLPVRTA